MFGKIGVNIFVLITAYFSYGAKFNIEKLVKIELKVLFYSLSLLLISGLLEGFNSISIKDIIKSCFPTLTECWWYVSAFFILSFLMPFMSKCAACLSRRDYKLLLMVLLTIYSLIPTLTFRVSNAYGMNNYLFIPIMCLIGFFVRKFEIKSNKIIFSWLWICIFLQIISVLFLSILLNNTYSVYFRTANSVLSVAISTLLLIVATSQKCTDMPLINKIASLAFGAYLLQEHIIFRDILWKDIFRLSNYGDKWWLILWLFACVVMILCMTTIFDWLAKLCSRLLGIPITRRLRQLEVVKQLEGV